MLRSAFLALLFAGMAAAAEPAQPVAVDPGGPGKAPSDAVVLFSGSNLDEWQHKDGSPAKWTVENGEIVCNTGSGNLQTKRKFGSAQIHVEFATPNQTDVKGQARGNSGVYLQGRYEVQVLDSFQSPTYADGQAGAVYQQYPPLVNASRPPEQWQTFDIIFHAPNCYGDRFLEPGRVTVLHNGVLIQDNVELKGPTPGGLGGDVCEPGPIMLQDHVHREVEKTALRYRNLWLRPLD